MTLGDKKYAFVIPRYGQGIAGGAETLVGSLAERLALAGVDVTVLTTCAKDNRTWENFFPNGCSREQGVTVHRFPVRERNLDVWIPLQVRLSEGLRLTVEEELSWMAESVNSDELYGFIRKYSSHFDALFFAPYLFGTTFWGSLIAPERSVLIPCLHDECYAYTSVVQSMFRQVRGCLFNALPEKQLAQHIYGEVYGDEVGMGFDPFDERYVESLEPFLNSDLTHRYLLYMGRKETGKNVHVLLDLFVEAKSSGALPEDTVLVIAGGGEFRDLHREAYRVRPDIIDVEHVSERDKHRLMRHAGALVQPSTNESFSIVLMESWLLGVPVLVHARCPVTKYHVEQSQGGLYFGDLGDFVGVINELLSRPSLRDTMGKNGSMYVQEKYGWDAVLNRFMGVTEAILSSPIRELRGAAVAV